MVRRSLAAAALALAAVFAMARAAYGSSLAELSGAAAGHDAAAGTNINASVPQAALGAVKRSVSGSQGSWVDADDGRARTCGGGGANGWASPRSGSGTAAAGWTKGGPWAAVGGARR